MKKQFLKRSLSMILAIIMVAVMMPLSILNVFSVEEDEQIPYFDGGAVEKYRLDIINGIVSNQELISYVESKFDEMNIDSEVDIGKSTSQTILSGGKKWCNIAASGLKIVGGILTLTGHKPAAEMVGALGDIAGSIGGIAGELIEDNSTDILMKQMQEMQKEIGEQLSNINSQIKNLSDEQRANISKLGSYLTDENERQKYEAKLLEFSSTADGNDRFGIYKDYYSWRNELYTAFNALILANETDENLFWYYDNLYVIAKQSDVLYEYLMPTYEGWGDITIQEVLYRYYIYSKHKDGNIDFQTCIEECLEYSRDWYATYELSQMCLNICYIYQLQSLINEHGECNLEGKYYYPRNNDGLVINDQQVAYSLHIAPFLKNPMKKLNEVTAEMTKYYARILNLDESFIYEIGPEHIYYVQYQEMLNEGAYEAPITQYEGLSNTCYVRTNNRVSCGDILYMNVMPETFSNIFDMSLFAFEVDDKDLATVDNAGVVKVTGESGSFTVTMYYDGYEIYSLKFDIEERLFYGGMGSKTAPYLISSAQQIIKIAQTKKYYDSSDIYFKLVNDINDFNGIVFAGIPTFKGVFDGNGYSIYGFMINGNINSDVGFFQANNGKVKNLTIGEVGETSFSGYSAEIVSGRTENYGHAILLH